MKRRTVQFYILMYAMIFIAALIVMAFVVFARINTLTKETLNIAAMDINYDSVDTTVRLKGKYGIVEKTIKEYMNEYVEGIQAFSEISSDDRIVEMLGTENMMKDAPDFTGSRAYLEKKRAETKELASKLIKMGTQESIDQTFNDTGLNFFMKRVYNSQMYKNITLDFFYPAREIEKAEEQLEKLFDGKEEVMDFLTDHKDSWHFSGEMIEFENEELLAEYLSISEGK